MLLHLIAKRTARLRGNWPRPWGLVVLAASLAIARASIPSSVAHAAIRPGVPPQARYAARENLHARFASRAQQAPPGPDPFADLNLPPLAQHTITASATFGSHALRSTLPAVVGLGLGAAITSEDTPLALALVVFLIGSAVTDSGVWAFLQSHPWRSDFDPGVLQRAGDVQHPLAAFMGRWMPYVVAVGFLLFLQRGRGKRWINPVAVRPTVHNRLERRLQLILTLGVVLCSAGLAMYTTLNPPLDNQEAQISLSIHPVASIAGALLPTLIIVPIAYWMFGRISRRIAARYKVCEFCAETIKAPAKVCPYCGRDVTSDLRGMTPASTGEPHYTDQTEHRQE